MFHLKRCLTACVVLSGAIAMAAGTMGKGSAHARMVARGRYLVTVVGCNDCHTPHVFDPKLHGPVPDMSRMLSGHPANGPKAPASKLMGHDLAVIGPTFTSFQMPFGTVYSANLTPDKDTGLGSWTFAMFKRALREGKHMGGKGRGILPPMPWQGFRNFTNYDLASIWAFLHSIKPIKNAVPAPQVPPPAIQGITKSNEMFVQMMKHMGHHPMMKMRKKAPMKH